MAVNMVPEISRPPFWRVCEESWRCHGGCCFFLSRPLL